MIRNRDRVAGSVRKVDVLQIRNKEKSTIIEMEMASAFLSADPVFKLKYDAIVDITSLKETEGVSKRVIT